MRILVDENIPQMTVRSLRALGHDVKDIRGSIEQGLPDPDLMSVAVSESRLLVTTDKGFATYRTSPHPGILIVRLRQPNRHKIHSAVMQAIQRFQEGEWPNRFVVVRDTTMSTSVFTAPGSFRD
jgi:predicted nuclease of predicted toxin-antitoxin system